MLVVVRLLTYNWINVQRCFPNNYRLAHLLNPQLSQQFNPFVNGLMKKQKKKDNS